MPSNNPFATQQDASSHRRSLLGSLKSFGRRKSTASARSNSSKSSFHSPASPTFRAPFEQPAMGNPYDNEQHFPTTTEAPPAYSVSGPALTVPPSIRVAELADNSNNTFQAPRPASRSSQRSARQEDPYTFLSNFDTVLLIDDSGSMIGSNWKEVAQALSLMAPIITSHDSDGMDIYFLNHLSSDKGGPGIAPTGYRGIKRASTVSEIFRTVRPNYGTPTGTRIHHILKPYLAKAAEDAKVGIETKPLNLIVLTDGAASDDVESVLISCAKKLDKLDAPPFQVGVQFFQVGNDSAATAALKELDDELGNRAGVRDMVDTVTWSGRDSGNLTGDGILKVVLGAVNRKLDRRNASGEFRRSQEFASRR